MSVNDSMALRTAALSAGAEAFISKRDLRFALHPIVFSLFKEDLDVVIHCASDSRVAAHLGSCGLAPRPALTRCRWPTTAGQCDTTVK